MARAAAGAPGPVRPRPPRAAGSAVISWPPRMPMGTGPGGAGTVPCWPGGCRGREAGRGGGSGPGFAGAGDGLLVSSYSSYRSRSGLGVVRAGAVCRGRPGGGGAGRAVQGGDDRGRRRGGFEAGGEHRAGPVAAPAADAGQGDGGADRDGGSQSDQRPGRQPYPGRGGGAGVRRAARRPGCCAPGAGCGPGRVSRWRPVPACGGAGPGGRRRAGSRGRAGGAGRGGDQQVPSGVDPGGVGEGAPAGLRPAAVEGVDLVPAVPAAEVGAGQVPQGVAGHDGVHAAVRPRPPGCPAGAGRVQPEDPGPVPGVAGRPAGGAVSPGPLPRRLRRPRAGQGRRW